MVTLQQCKTKGDDQIVHQTCVCSAMLAVEIADFIRQQIKEEEWQEAKEVAKIHAGDGAKWSTIDLDNQNRDHLQLSFSS